MSVVTIAELEAKTGKSDSGTMQASLDAAEAIVAARGLLVESIGERALVIKQTMKHTSSMLIFDDGPAVTVNSITVDGTARDLSELLIDIWSAEYQLKDNTFPTNAIIEVDMTAGWNDTNIPANLTEAVLMQAAVLDANPSGLALTGRRLGDFAENFATQAGADAIDHAALRMCNAYRRPNWF